MQRAPGLSLLPSLPAILCISSARVPHGALFFFFFF